MAVRYAVADGKWSATATWDGGTLPQAGDDVYANSYTVEVDQDIEVAKISTEVCPTTSVGGGKFYTPTNKTFICDIVAGLSTCVDSGSVYNLRYYVIGNIYGSDDAPASGIRMVASNYSSPYVNCIGNLYAGSKGVAIYSHNTVDYRYFTLSVVGNLYSSSAFKCVDSKSGNIRNVDIVGDCISLGQAVMTRVQNLTINGSIKSSSSSPAIFGVNSTDALANISGVLENSNSTMAIIGFYYIYLSPSSSTVWKFYDTNDDEKILYTADAFDQPAESDVRDGVEYGSGVYEGTLIIPPVDSVVKNVPVDDTVGTYELTPEAIEHILELQNPKKVLGSGIIAY